MSPTTTRMNAEDRRALVIAAATRAFAAGGYAGTSTDRVAKEAGVSQPYVVRMFGTKLELFLAVFDAALERICRAFSEELAREPFDPDSDDDWGRLGHTYMRLVADRDLLMVMMHGITAGSVPEIGSAARARMGQVFTVLRASGGTDEQITEFVAHGMLLNVMLAMNAADHLEAADELTPLTVCAFGEGLDDLTAASVRVRTAGG